ncbi:MAG: FtsH protease activity modulator HflK [Thiohalomonadaceae bacterium]
MAWNEPGGSKDPWSGRGGEQGPPDLDEMMRKLQERFGGLFGRRRGTAPGGFNLSGLGFIIGVVFLVWAVSGIYIVDEGKRGVVLQFGAYHDTTGPGPHWYPRLIQEVIVVDVDSVRSVELGYRGDEGLMLTQDENLVDIKFAVQYRVKDARDYLFNVRDPDETLRAVTESAIREVVGRSKMDFVITGGRSEIVARSQQVLQETLDRYKTGLQVTSLNMQNAQAPEQVQGAFADAVKAREDEQRLINEAEAYANEILPKARGAAARVIEEANAYKEQVIAEAEGESARFVKVLAEYQKAPSIMRQRLYLDALESVLSRSSKVLVDTKGNNNLIYLPLDKITQREASTPSASLPAAVEQAAPAATVDTRSRDALRRREVR